MTFPFHGVNSPEYALNKKRESTKQYSAGHQKVTMTVSKILFQRNYICQSTSLGYS